MRTPRRGSQASRLPTRVQSPCCSARTTLSTTTRWRSRVTWSSDPIRALSQRVAVTYVVTQPGIDGKDKSCVDVSPVACIYIEWEAVDRKLYIHPHECIQCGACEPGVPSVRSTPRAPSPGCLAIRLHWSPRAAANVPHQETSAAADRASPTSSTACPATDVPTQTCNRQWP